MPEDWENVILLSADALRADHLSCYGYHRETSPELDAFAEESIRFTNAYSASSHTREAVPALLTGKYPDVAVDENYHLASETIASRLSEEGYATAGFHSNPFCSRAYGFDRGFDYFDDDLHLGQHKLIALAQRVLDKVRNRHYARAEKINERSLAWLDSLPDDEPFFLWNHYMDTHGPYEPPGKYRMLYADGRVSDDKAQSLYQRAVDDPESITDEERQLLMDLYDAEIRYNDEWIGKFLGELRKRDLLKKSLLIVTADHGDAFNEHGYYEHPRYLHDEITHVPLFVRLPRGSEGEVKIPTSTLDVVATVSDAIGRKYSGPGQSVLDEMSKDRQVFSQVRGENADSHLRRFAVRSCEETAFGEYNTERESMTITEADLTELEEALEAHVEEREGVERIAGTDKDVDEEIEQRLSALGYTE